jgi:RHS repeat-associated protein
VLSAAKEETFSAFGPWCAETCISASECEGKKPHQGVASKNPALHQGITWSNSTVALGLCGARLETRVRSRCTGKERDTESGLDDFDARHYGSSLGRFMQPDPMGGHLEDPQTLNRYAYVRNNPLSLADPTGLDFYLSCTQTKDNASTCQSQTVGYDKNGNAQTATVQGVTGDNGFTATQIGNDANGNLVDRTTGTGAYTADVTGSGVQLSNNAEKHRQLGCSSTQT